MSKNQNPMKVVTGPDTRWSYVNAWEPKSINGGAPKYSVSLIIPKSDTKTVAKIRAAIEAAYHDGEDWLYALRSSSSSVKAISIFQPFRSANSSGKRISSPTRFNSVQRLERRIGLPVSYFRTRTSSVLPLPKQNIKVLIAVHGANIPAGIALISLME